MADCQTTTGWGSGWGVLWGGGGGFVPGGPIPAIDPYDVYCVCGEGAANIDSYDEVQTSPPGLPYFSADPGTDDYVITSVDGTDAFLFIDKPVGANATLETALVLASLPPNFSQITQSHLFVGVANSAGAAAGLYLSKVGVAYAGAYGAPFQVIPGSQTWVTEGEAHVVHLAIDASMGAVFVYITPVAQALLSGQVLRAILPIIPYSSLPPGTLEGTSIHVAGTATHPSVLGIDAICQSSHVIVPNMPPVADAGPDQATRTCQVILLDGSASFDPEGTPLKYSWRLIDAPLGSLFVFAGQDGTSYPLDVPTGYTNKFYSSSFGGADPFPIAPGDVLVVEGKTYEVLLTGTDLSGDFVQVTDYTLPDSLTNVGFKLVKQNGISGKTTVKPTFYPDVPGFYKFDLQVFDGNLYSDYAVTAVNVLEAALPRGIVPDLRFLWNYLSDFWSLLEDRDRIETIWSGLAQTAATELFTLWQTEYSKSLRDVQRQFIRRWLNYDLLLREPFLELTRLRVPFTGVDSANLTTLGATYAGLSLVLSVPFLDDLISFTVSTADTLTTQQLAKLVQTALRRVDTRFTVTVVPLNATDSAVRVYAPFPFTVVAGTTLPFTPGASNGPLGGSAGLLTSDKVYKVEQSLLGVDLQEDDLLAVRTGSGQVCVRVAAVVDSAADAYRFQRLLLKDPLPLDAGAQWVLPAVARSTQLDFYAGLVTDKDIATVEISDTTTGDSAYVGVEVVGVAEKLPNAVAFLPDDDYLIYLAGSSRFSVHFWGVYRRGYLPIEDIIVDIPYLQHKIKGAPEDEVLRRNLDFYVEKFRGRQCVRFEPDVWPARAPFVPRLWAEYTYLDNRPIIEANFGVAVDFMLEDLETAGTSTDYLSAVRGLFYAHLNGPTLFSLRAGAQIMLGLPFAEEASIIEEIRTDFSPNQGRILLRDKSAPDLVRSYSYPKGLTLETNPDTGEAYKEGDEVAQFAPLVSGVEVVDWVKDPSWFQGLLNQGLFYEVEKFHRFLVRVNSNAFKLSTLLFVRSFVLRVKPTYTYPLFLVLRSIDETEIDVQDDPHYVGTLKLFDGALTKEGYGHATMFDEPDPSPGQILTPGGPIEPATGYKSGHAQSAFDEGTDGVAPVVPDPASKTGWGFDAGYLTPEQLLWADACTTSASPTTPTFDSVFSFDKPLWSGTKFVMGQEFVRTVLPGGTLLNEVVAGAPGSVTVSAFFIYVMGTPRVGHENFRFQLYVQNVLTVDLPFTHAAFSQSAVYGPAPAVTPLTPFTINPGDSLQAVIRADGASVLKPFLRKVTVTFGEATAWSFDMGLPGGPAALPAGTYCKVGTL